MTLVDCPSPNFNSRDGQPVDMLVLHYTGMPTMQAAKERLCDGMIENKVSAHYLVDEDGTVYQLVDEAMRAWHAGKSFWRGNTNINQRSIGIEIVNPGHEFGYRAFPKAQMEAVAELCQGILARHNIPRWNVVAHSDIAPERKEDPGELFDWKFLAEHGVGTFPPPLRGRVRVGGGSGPDKINITPPPNLPPQGGEELAKYGYSTANLSAAITAFQRHFRPKLLNGKWDDECAALLSHLLDSSL